MKNRAISYVRKLTVRIECTMLIFFKKIVCVSKEKLYLITYSLVSGREVDTYIDN